MKLYIAEKPSLGRAIAEALPPPLKKQEGFIRAANGDVVSWCIGHLLEQVEPEVYDSKYKRWTHEHLPIVPKQWQLSAKKQTSKQLRILKKCIQEADQLVHAGDPDREGQLLVDEVIDFVGVKGAKRQNIKRCLINDLNLPAVKTSLANLRDNSEFIPLSVSALARSRADWLYGINLTRAYTLQGQKVGYKGVLSVGRVQTPLLGLVVNRDKEIANFVSKPYYNVWAILHTEKGEQFSAKWQPSEHCAKYLDEQGRNLSQALAQNVAKRVSFQSAKVLDISRKKKSQAAPLPHNLSALQIDANKIYGLSAQQVLDTCQALYEKHKAITYPRSDCRYLPKAHFSQREQVLNVIQQNLATVSPTNPLSHRHDNTELFHQLRRSQQSKAWNDSKVGAHHGIIPTQKKLSSLNATELKVYRLVCRNYVAQFLAHHTFFDSKATIEIEKGLFVAKAKEAVDEGWKPLFESANSGAKRANPPTSLSGDGGKVNECDTGSNEERSTQYLPPLKKGQDLRSLEAEIEEKHTSPPKHFTEATLLSAMTGINAFVKDPELKKVLKDTDGLGTEATRAGIIELLFKRGFMRRSGKTIKASDAGRALIEALPDSATTPDRTAHWESILTSICERQAKYETLMSPLLQELSTLVLQSQSVVPIGLKGLASGQKNTFKRGAKSKTKSPGGSYKKRAKKTSKTSITRAKKSAS